MLECNIPLWQFLNIFSKPFCIILQNENELLVLLLLLRLRSNILLCLISSLKLYKFCSPFTNSFLLLCLQGSSIFDLKLFSKKSDSKDIVIYSCL